MKKHLLIIYLILLSISQVKGQALIELKSDYTPVNPRGPLLKDIEWNQWIPHNIYFWNNTLDEVLMGCVAIAGAQVMKYYNYPLIGKGSHRYFETDSQKEWIADLTNNEPHYGYISTSFSDKYYNWHLFPNSSSFSFSDDENEYDMSEAIFDIAVSVEMDFGYSESASFVENVFGADLHNSLEQYFGYSGIEYKGSGALTNIEEWKSLIKNEIDNNRPVICRADAGLFKGGHAFICDGYDDDDRFHFNFGWRDGIGNGWYPMDDITPPVNGDPDYSYGILNKTAMLIGIQPDYENPAIDQYETDDNFIDATVIKSNEHQLHSISPIGDKDYYTFNLETTADVTIETKGVNGNTQVWLYNGTQSYIGYDDDSGDNNNARIFRQLSAGRYYFLVEEKGDDITVPSYSILFSALSDEPQLSLESVYPQSGNEETDFYFSVKYTDRDRDIPIINGAKLYIYGNQDLVLNFSLESGDAADGIYSCTTKLPIGSYKYRISFKNSSNQDVITDLIDGPDVYNSNNMSIIPRLICEVEETNEIEFRYEINDEGYNDIQLKVGKNDKIDLTPNSRIDFSLNTNGNYTFSKYKLIQNGEIEWEYDLSSSSTYIQFSDYAAGEFELRIYLDYTPISYVVSGSIKNNDNSLYSEPINISLSGYEYLTTTSSAGNYTFENVKGGVPIKVEASGIPKGYSISPDIQSISNLRRDENNIHFTISSNDIIAPNIVLLEYPEKESTIGEVNFSWTGNDDVTDESSLLFQYKLIGYDLSFSSWSDVNEVNYELPNGIYTLLIQCKDESGNIRNNPFEYSFVVNGNPQITSFTQIDKGLWYSDIVVTQTRDNLSENIVVLQSLNSIDELVPLRLYNKEDNRLIGGLDKIAEIIKSDTVFISQNGGYKLKIPDEFPQSNSLEYTIEWGKLIKFGWQDQHTFPKGFSNLTDIAPLNSDISEGKIIDADGNIWRVAVSKKRIQTDDKYINDSWAYLDKANSSNILIDEKQIEYLAGSWSSGEYYIRPECSSVRIFEIDSYKYVFINEEKYERNYVNGNAIDSDYSRYVIKKFDGDGNQQNQYINEWILDEQIDNTLKALHDNIIITSENNLPNGNRSLFFQIVNKNCIPVSSRTTLVDYPSGHDLDFEYCLQISDDKVIMLFEHEWETSLDARRNELCFQIRNISGSLIKNTTRINQSFISDASEDDDRFFFNSAITDIVGNTWISYERRTSGIEDRFYYIILDQNGNVIHGVTEFVGDQDIDFKICDKDGFVMAVSNNYIHLFGTDFNKSTYSRSGFIIPNSEYSSFPSNIDYYSYSIFDKWSSSLLSVNQTNSFTIDSLEIFNYPINTDISVDNLTIELNGSNINSNNTALDDSISIDLKPYIEEGNNTLSISQNGLLGGNIILALPSVKSEVGTDIETNNLEGDEIEVYPNPISSHFKISCRRISGNTYSLFDMCGRKIIIDIKENRTINCSFLPNGIYFLTINGESNQTFKLIKK